MADYYYDYLVDCGLIIGANEQSGLIKSSNDTSHETSDQADKYQQQIIAAVSSTVAMFPFATKAYTYPPEEFDTVEKLKTTENVGSKAIPKSSLKRQVSLNEFQTIHEIVNQYNKNEVPESVRPNKNFRRTSNFRSKRRSIKDISVDNANGAWGSVSMERMKSFPATYFKDNLKISKIYVAPSIQFILLTDNIGNRSFAIRLEFYRKFSMNESNAENTGLVTIEPVKKEDEDSSNIAYVSNNLIFFTKFPYFDLFRDILSKLFQRIDRESTGKIEQELMEYSLILTRIPIMKSECLQLKFVINNDIFGIKPVIPVFNEIIDWDMTILFQTLSIDDIISILIAMFHDQKMVFLSNDSNLTTIITETIFLLYRPFQWKHVYLTTIPSNLYMLIDAICPFILGLPYEMKPKIVEYYPEIIIVDLVEGKTFIPTTCHLNYVSKELTDNLKEALKQRDWMNSNRVMSGLNFCTLDDLRLNYEQFNKDISQKVLTIFMTFMVDLFQEIIRNISTDRTDGERIVVSLDKYLNTSQSQNIAFLKEFKKSDNFNCFVNERIRKKTNDAWFRIYSQRYKDVRSESNSRTKGTIKSERSRADSEMRLNDVDIVKLLAVEKIQQEIIFPSRKNVRGDFYQDLLENMDKLDHSLDKMKLRAEIILHTGNTINALEVFHKILQENPFELNHSKLRRLIRSMGKKDFLILKEKRFHESLFEIISFNERRFSLKDIETTIIEHFNPPTIPIAKNNFIDECRNADIAEYEVVMNILFNCLTIDCKISKNRIKAVRPEIFKCFYNNWINSSIDLKDVTMPSELFDETLIKGTETYIRVDGFGFGRVILTQYRICFIPFGKTNSETIINLTDDNARKIKLEKKIRGFGKMTDVLELPVTKRDQKIIIWTSQESSIWNQLISELSSVNRLAEEEKDKNLLDVTTELCLLYENAVTCSRKDSYFKNNINEIRKKMLPHVNEKKSKSQDGDQRKYIIAKLMPSPKKMVSIDNAVEIYKPYVNNFDIWCACMSRDVYFISILQIIDRKLHKTDVAKIEIPMRIQTMVRLPNTNKIAVCCMSHVVLIIDSNSHTIEKKIELQIGNGAYPLCSSSSEFDQKVLYFGTNQGDILCWDSLCDKVHQIAKLPNDDLAYSIHIYNSTTLIIGSLYGFYVVNLSSEIINIVAVTEIRNPMSKVGYISLLNNNTTLIVGLARLPVLLEYDIFDIQNITCIRRKNIFTSKNFISADISENHELSSSYVGITSVLMTDGKANVASLWIMMKDGSIEIRDYKTWTRKTKFNAHVDVINKAMMCTIKNQKVIVSVGREDGKVNIWSLTPNDI